MHSTASALSIDLRAGHAGRKISRVQFHTRQKTCSQIAYDLVAVGGRWLHDGLRNTVNVHSSRCTPLMLIVGCTAYLLLAGLRPVDTVKAEAIGGVNLSRKGNA